MISYHGVFKVGKCADEVTSSCAHSQNDKSSKTFKETGRQGEGDEERDCTRGRLRYRALPDKQSTYIQPEAAQWARTARCRSKPSRAWRIYNGTDCRYLSDCAATAIEQLLSSWRMTKWLSERAAKRPNRKTIQNKQPKTERRGTGWARERTSILVSCAVDWRLGRIAGVISKSISGTTTTTRPSDHATQNSISLFSLQSPVSFSFVSFDLISSFLGGGKVLFELLARWDTHRCDVFCNLFRIRSPLASASETDRSQIATIYCRVHAPIAIKLCHIHFGTRRAWDKAQKTMSCS